MVAQGLGLSEGLTVGEAEAVKHSEGEGERVTEGQRLTLTECESVGVVVEDTESERVTLAGEGELVGLTLGEAEEEAEAHSEAVRALVRLTVLERDTSALMERLGLPEELALRVKLREVVRLGVGEAEGEPESDSHMEKEGVAPEEALASVAEARADGEACVTVPAQVLLTVGLAERLCVEERE